MHNKLKRLICFKRKWGVFFSYNGGLSRFLCVPNQAKLLSFVYGFVFRNLRKISHSKTFAFITLKISVLWKIFVLKTTIQTLLFCHFSCNLYNVIFRNTISFFKKKIFKNGLMKSYKMLTTTRNWYFRTQNTAKSRKIGKVTNFQKPLSLFFLPILGEWTGFNRFIEIRSTSSTL